jgi:hypothetical protein
MTKQSFPISYGVVPAEGPRTLERYVLTFAGAGSQYISLGDEMAISEEMNHVQAIYIDAADAGGVVTVTALQTGQRVRIPAARQGWFNMLFPPGVGDVRVDNTLAGVVYLTFANVPVAPQVWATT